MRPINDHQRKILERRVNSAVCPMNVQGSDILVVGIFPNDELPVRVFRCFADGGAAREKLDAASSYSFGPCTFEYAGKCPVYRQEDHTTKN